MMSEENMKLVGNFNRMPPTPEKQDIQRRYINDEICVIDFLAEAEKYITKERPDNAGG